MAKKRDTRITVTIEPGGEGMVKLTLIHDDFDENSLVMQSMQKRGWPPILAGLKQVMEEE